MGLGHLYQKSIKINFMQTLVHDDHSDNNRV